MCYHGRLVVIIHGRGEAELHGVFVSGPFPDPSVVNVALQRVSCRHDILLLAIWQRSSKGLEFEREV